MDGWDGVEVELEVHRDLPKVDRFGRFIARFVKTIIVDKLIQAT